MVRSALKIIISGTVQGSLFKNFTKDHADRLNLKGFIRNLENGDIEVMTEGEKEDIVKLVDILRKGPPHALIKNVKTEEKKWSGELKEFKVLTF